MAEAGNPGVAAGKIAPATALRPHYEFDVIAGRIAETDEGLDLALLGLARRASMNGMAERFQRGGGILQACFVLDLEADGLIARISFRIAQRMTALVGAKIKILL